MVLTDQELASKYRKLIGVDDECDLKALKARYAALQDKFNAQLKSGDSVQTQKGQKNILLLDQAYNVLAQDIRLRQEQSFQQETEKAVSGMQNLSIELDSFRVGFQILHGSLFAIETSSVETNLFGLHAKKTNNQVSARWPSGKLVVYSDHFKLKCIFGSVDISFDDILEVKKVWYLPLCLCVSQKHDNDTRISIFGFGLDKKIKEMSSQFSTPLTLQY
ncbi:MAG: hypothetical protein C0614_12900 [Desulfuromonas sp.]|nr:MAG: hypothetical protein C0614_12900 [Desulfuromonas sp.]